MLWGLYFGVLIIIERLGFGKILEKLPSGISMLYTFLAAVFGWVLFDTDTLSDAGRFIAAMFGAGGVAVDGYFKYTLVSNCFLLVMCILISGGIGSRIAEYAGEKSRSFKAISTTVLVTGGLLLCTAYLVDASYNPFLYFRF